MSETLSAILYNSVGDGASPDEDHSYGRALSLTQSYLSEHFASTLADTVLQEQAREHVRYLIEQFLIGEKVYVAGMSVQELTTRLYRDMAGKTGSGKTTLLSYLLNNLDVRQRIVTIEETREILIVNPRDDEGRRTKSVLALYTRPSEDEHLNIDMRSLLRTSLRLCPDIITMAEMRGPEAMDSQEAARTGHTVASTLHANSAAQAYARIMTMCQMSATTVPVHILMELIVEAFPIAVFCKQTGQKQRCIMEVVEAYGAFDGQVRTNPIFQYDGEGKWTRKSAISEKTAELLLNNGADADRVRRLTAAPAKGGSK